MSRQGDQLHAEPRRPPAGPASIDQRGLAARTSLSRQDTARRLPATPPTLCLPLSSYYFLIFTLYLYYLDRARKATVLFEVLCEVTGPATGLPQFRHRFPVRARCAWYMPPKLAFPFISLAELGIFNALRRIQIKKWALNSVNC